MIPKNCRIFMLMEYKSKFKIGDVVLVKTELGTYSTKKTVTRILTNLVQVKWVHEGKTHYYEYLDNDLIHAKGD